jgi:hypothetical protein
MVDNPRRHPQRDRRAPEADTRSRSSSHFVNEVEPLQL